jgi:hypothetical protein
MTLPVTQMESKSNDRMIVWYCYWNSSHHSTKNPFYLPRSRFFVKDTGKKKMGWNRGKWILGTGGIGKAEIAVRPADQLGVPFLDLTQDIAQHFFVFQANGEEDCFQWPCMRHVNGGMGMEFGPVEKAIEGFLVFFVQTSAKPFPSFTLRFQNITEGHSCSAHISSMTVFRHHPLFDLEIE